MNIWFFIQLSANIALGGAIFLLWSKFQKPAKEDPRLSKGLQLLQSKIAILEDLSDRTEVLVKQLNTLMDSKVREIHNKIEQANIQVHAVEKSISKSREIAQLFQEKIPHEEIIERKTTLKYIQAARLAHEGVTSDEISRKLDIPSGEVDLIVQMNQGELLFAEETLQSGRDQIHRLLLRLCLMPNNQRRASPKLPQYSGMQTLMKKPSDA